jgi:hypothetical protein
MVEVGSCFVLIAGLGGHAYPSESTVRAGLSDQLLIVLRLRCAPTSSWLRPCELETVPPAPTHYSYLSNSSSQNVSCRYPEASVEARPVLQLLVGPSPLLPLLLLLELRLIVKVRLHFAGCVVALSEPALADWCIPSLQVVPHHVGVGCT